MKVYWSNEEKYPIIDLNDENVANLMSGSIELTEEEYKDYCRVQMEYDSWQKRITKLIEDDDERISREETNSR